MYRALLGDAWLALPEVVRAVHAPGEVRGSLRVAWGAGWLSRLLARCLRFPRPAASEVVELAIEQRDQGSRWVRRIGATALVTEQWVHGGLVHEALGLMVCAFRVHADAQGVWYAQQFAALRMGPTLWRLPRWLGPRVAARVTRVGDVARSEVEISVPLLGTILKYDGLVTRATSESGQAS